MQDDTTTKREKPFDAKGMIFIPTAKEYPAAPINPKPKTVKESENRLREALGLADSNFDGFLSREEIKTVLPIQAMAINALNPTITNLNEYNASVSNAPTLARRGTVTDDTFLFDRGAITEIFIKNPLTPGLTPEKISKIVDEILPKGVATIKLSDECNALEESNVQCVPLPHNKMLLGGRGGPST